MDQDRTFEDSDIRQQDITTQTTTKFIIQSVKMLLAETEKRIIAHIDKKLKQKGE